jgi:hypothetical protein
MAHPEETIKPGMVIMAVHDPFSPFLMMMARIIHKIVAQNTYPSENSKGAIEK